MEHKYEIGDLLRIVGGTCDHGEPLDGNSRYHYFTDGTIITVHMINEYATDDGYMICKPVDPATAWVDGDDLYTQNIRDCDVEPVAPREFNSITDVEQYLSTP